MVGAIAEALRIVERPREPIRDALDRYMKTKELLLVLDNFEQIIDAAPLVADLIARSPKLRILVTSRVPLHVTGEQQFVVPPLQVAELRTDRRGPHSRSDAAAIFIQRALAAKPSLLLDEANLDTIEAICARVDGLPLAIELAAARSRVLSPTALLARLDRRLPLLSGAVADAPARQHSMRAAIEWSYDLLKEREREAVELLAVFSGGCTLDAAADVCGSDASIGIVALISTLIDASLLGEEVQPDGEPRFTMLETIREFGLERLTEHDRLESARAVHAAHYLALADVARPALRGARPQTTPTSLVHSIGLSRGGKARRPFGCARTSTTSGSRVDCSPKADAGPRARWPLRRTLPISCGQTRSRRPGRSPSCKAIPINRARGRRKRSASFECAQINAGPR